MAQRRGQELNILPGVLMIAGLVLMAISFVLTTTRSSSQSGMWMNQMPSTVTGYGITNLLLAIMGAFMFTSGLMYLFLRQEYEPLPPSVMPSVLSARSPYAIGAPGRIASQHDIRSDPYLETGLGAPNQPPATGLAAVATESIAPAPNDGHRSTYYLTLRLLSGDERAMFRAIMDSGGEALQKDLILKTKMSDAKVSRVIDRLEEKGVVAKMRFGMTNKVRLEIET